MILPESWASVQPIHVFAMHPLLWFPVLMHQTIFYFKKCGRCHPGHSGRTLVGAHAICFDVDRIWSKSWYGSEMIIYSTYFWAVQYLSIHDDVSLALSPGIVVNHFQFSPLLSSLNACMNFLFMNGFVYDSAWLCHRNNKNGVDSYILCICYLLLYQIEIIVWYCSSIMLWQAL